MTDTPSVDRLARPGVESCEYVGPGAYYWSRGPQIFRSDTVTSDLLPVARVPDSGLRSRLSIGRLGRRLTRRVFYNILPTADGSLFYSFGTTVGVVRDGKATPLTGRGRQSKILRNAVAELPSGDLVFGEYFSNPDRVPVNVYRWTPGDDSLRVAYTFPAGAIRHIHSITWDTAAGRAVVASGDIEDECALTAFDPDFISGEAIGQGDERWRTISPQYTDRAIFWGTDAEFMQNRIYRLNRADRTLSPVGDVNGTMFYSAPLGCGWIFGSTAELCPSQTSPEAILYHLDSSGAALTPIARFPKDRLPLKLFQFGVLNIPHISPKAIGQPIPISGTALKGLDGTFICVQG